MASAPRVRPVRGPSWNGHQSRRRSVGKCSFVDTSGSGWLIPAFPGTRGVDNSRRISTSVNVHCHYIFDTCSSATRESPPPTRIPITRSMRSCGPASAARHPRRHRQRGETSRPTRPGAAAASPRRHPEGHPAGPVVPLRPAPSDLGAELRERDIGLHVIEQGIDTATMEGRAMFGMLSVLAELQRELIVANTMDGLASARARGRVGGRRPDFTPDQAHWPSSSTTSATRPCSRSPTCSTCPGRRCTGTSTLGPRASAQRVNGRR